MILTFMQIKKKNRTIRYTSESIKMKCKINNKSDDERYEDNKMIIQIGFVVC